MTGSDNGEIIEGRRYNNDEGVEYLLPNDNEEADRLHEQHYIFRYALQRNYHAPVKDQLEKGINVIDAGCGPASWTLDMAKAYPQSKFTGADISFISTNNHDLNNLSFETCNITGESPFPDNTFDYYFQRLLVAGLSKSNYEAALKNAFKILKPGGYIELVEPNLGSFYNMGPILEKLLGTMSYIMEMRGMTPNLGENLESLLECAGFVNIKVISLIMPINHTNKIGELWWRDIERGYHNVRPMLALNNPAFERPENYRVYLDSIADECRQMKTDSKLNIVYAQKPE
ncbi:S-adenosyl-L-methionine-dependent methyltransferase [Pilobolus umbonatus]|nr:S-adenosyl-L-methionine-dependent methyltransferase [Pilobolus umbonatus]